MKYFDKFHPDTFYHIFNHVVGFENLFRSHDNFLYFLEKFEKHFDSVGKVYAYCLMPNHFHFLVQIRDQESLIKLAKVKTIEELDVHKFVMQRISNCLNGYAKAFNVQYSRRGSLFQDFTRRVKLDEEFSILAVLRYIHQNPVHHGFCLNVLDWAYSSYRNILYGDEAYKVEREAVLVKFGGVTNFIDAHVTNL